MKQWSFIAALALALSAPVSAQDDGSGSATGAPESEESETGGTSAPPQETPPDEAIKTIPVQVKDDQENIPAPSEPPSELGEVVVTAQRIRQSARDVPVSVTALSGENIRQRGAVSLADVSLYVPNARVDAHDLGSPQIFIRGFGTNAFNPSFESSVAFVQDDIYFGRPGYFTETMFDVDRVEVLRGPQGTLFGKNTVAGIYNVVTRGPEGDFATDVHYFRGEHNENRVEAGVGGMFNDWIGVRAAGFYRKTDGELRNTFQHHRNEDNPRQQAGRVKIRILPGFGLDSELSLMASDTHAAFWPFQLLKLDDDTRSYLQGFDPDIEDNPKDFKTEFDTPGFIDKGSDTASFKTQWSPGGVGPFDALHSALVLGYSRFRIDQLNELDVSPADISRLDNHERHRQYSGELRFDGRSAVPFGLGDGLDFVGGVYYFRSDYRLLARVLAGADLGSYVLTDDFAQLASENGDATTTGGLGLPGIPGFGPVTQTETQDDFYQFDYNQDIASKALFGQITWHLTEHWAITPGLRLTHEYKRVDAAGQGQCPAKVAFGQDPSPCAMQQLLQAKDYAERNLTRRETDLSPKAALQYFGDHINYYTSYARGFKSGGFNAISFTGDQPADPGAPPAIPPTPEIRLEYKPEKARTVELGVKGRFFGRTLGINAALFQTRFDNLQVLAFNGVFFTVSNAATARSRGLETDFTWLTPYAPLRLTGSLGVLDSRYIRYPDAPAPISQGINKLQDLSGRRIAFAPRSTATLTPTLTYLIGGFTLSAAGDVLHQGDQFTDTDLDPNTRIKPNTKFNARLIFANAANTWSLSVGGTNLSDKRVLNQVTDAVFFPGTYFANQAAGRQLFAAGSVQF